MQNSSKIEFQLLFKIDIKIADRIITLNVHQNDTIEDLLKNHHMGNHSNIEKFNLLKQKIRNSIKKQIQIKILSDQFQLANKMKLFLDKQTQIIDKKSSQNQPQPGVSNLSNISKQSSETPFKCLFKKSQLQVKLQQKQLLFDNNQQKKSNLNVKFIDSNLLRQNKSQIQQKQIKQKLIHLESSKENTKKQLICQKKIFSKKIDNDLIKAYEVIWKKSKDISMREMAQKTLKQLKVLPYVQRSLEFHSVNEMKKRMDQVEEEETVKSFLAIQSNSKGQDLLDSENEQVNKGFYSKSLNGRGQNKYSYLNQKQELKYPYQILDKSKSTNNYKYDCADTTFIQYLSKSYEQAPSSVYPIKNKRYNYLNH